MTTQAYLYKWTQKSTGKWYIGCRTAKNCHINDGYICSSKVVKPMILENADDWQREILCIGEVAYIRELESIVLSQFNAAGDPNSYNQYNNDLKFHTSTESKYLSGKRLGSLPRTAEWRQHIGESKRGKKRAPFSPDHLEKLKQRPHIHKPKSEDWKRQISQINAERNGITWLITRPDGSTTTTNNLRSWCREEFGELATSASSNIRIKPYKGYTAVKITA